MSCRLASERRARAQPLLSASVRERLALADRRVLLSLSAKRPHKNISALLDALALLDQRPVLVVAGYPTAYEQTLRARAQRLGLDEDVRWLGWLEPTELEGLWAITSAFVFPSLYEGFGLPVLEAMARGVPVACSNASTLPEVAGDAVLYFDPHDPRALADTLAGLLAGGHRGGAAAACGSRAGGAVHVGAHRATDARKLPPRAR